MLPTFVGTVRRTKNPAEAGFSEELNASLAPACQSHPPQESATKQDEAGWFWNRRRRRDRRFAQRQGALPFTHDRRSDVRAHRVEVGGPKLEPSVTLYDVCRTVTGIKADPEIGCAQAKADRTKFASDTCQCAGHSSYGIKISRQVGGVHIIVVLVCVVPIERQRKSHVLVYEIARPRGLVRS